MSRWTHEDVVASGLLGGALHAGARSAWPDAARDHFDGCADCQAILRADELARVAPIATSPRPRPALSELRKRLESRRAAPIEALAGALPAFGAARWRSEPNATPLELRRTLEGVRAADPEANHLLLFAVRRNEPPRLLGEARAERPGVSVDAQWEPAGEARAVAIGARAPLDRGLWELWLADRFRSEWPDRLVAGEVADRLHLADLEVRSVQQSMLRIREEPLPPTTDAVTAVLRPAAVHGRNGRLEPAAAGYRDALDLARATGDLTGEVKATLGLALALEGLGYALEAQAWLTSLASERVLDRAWAATLCRQMANEALNLGDLEAAERWIAEAEPLEVTPGWLALKRFDLAVRRGDDDAALAATQDDEVLIPEHAPLTELKRAWCLAGLGRVDELPDPLPHADHPHFSVLVMRMAAAARVDRARGRPHDWAGTLAALARILHRDRIASARQDAWNILVLFRTAREAGGTAASQLVRTCLLDAADARNPAVLALCAMVGPRNVLAVGPAPDAPVRDLPVDAAALARLVSAARTEAQADQGERALRTIRELLFPDGAPDGTIAIASDGSLADLPVAAALAAGLPGDRALPAIRIVTRPELRTFRDPASTAIVSLADAAGDLPAAAAEVLPHEAIVHLRGPEATFASLASSPPAGLIHLGVHGRRAHDRASLQFADREVGSEEIGQLRFQGGPVVLLSGCATAQRAAGTGVERSLADAFLRAGASAVIATAWNYDDAEMSDVVRALLALWPFSDPSGAVSQVVNALRTEGRSRRTWAGLVVYQSWPAEE